MEKLQVGKEERKKGSLKAVAWDDASWLPYENLKFALKEVSEHVDTSSGPTGMRAQWHQTLSQFTLKVAYL